MRAELPQRERLFTIASSSISKYRRRPLTDFHQQSVGRCRRARRHSISGANAAPGAFVEDQYEQQSSGGTVHCGVLMSALMCADAQAESR
jgi:hypothetical protein